MTPVNQLHSTFKKARVKLKLTQDEVAQKAEIQTNYYAMIERGERVPTIEVVFKIAKVLKIKLPFK